MTSNRVRRTSRELDQAAKRLRVKATTAEAELWEYLRAGRLSGYKFRRQHPVGRFILDFYCPAKRICIEVDGAIHDTQQERDAARDEVLASFNIEVIHVRNEDVLEDVQHVLARIRAALTER